MTERKETRALEEELYEIVRAMPNTTHKELGEAYGFSATKAGKLLNRAKNRHYHARLAQMTLERGGTLADM